MASFLAFVETMAEARRAVEGGADAVSPSAGAVLDEAELLAIIGGRAALCRWAGAPHDPAGTRGHEASVLLQPSRSAFPFEGRVPGRDSPATIVVFSEARPSAADLDGLAASGHLGVMLDAPGRLLDAVSLPDLAAFCEDCHGRGLLCGFSGGLEPPDVPRLLALGPDLLAFQRALRPGRGSEAAGFDPHAVRLVRDLIPLAPHRLLAGRSLQPMPQAGPVAHPPQLEGTTRIFVRDLVVEMAIGAYASEHGRTQRVRFSVEADLDDPRVRAQDTRQQASGDQDMRDVVSYDLLSDAIRQVAARAHVEFVETLAEAIAERVLVHRRIRALTVTVEKLDLGPGSVGVEIWRKRVDTPR